VSSFLRIISHFAQSNNHARHVFQGIIAAGKADWERKLSAGIAVDVRQRTVFYENKKLSAFMEWFGESTPTN
jgi:hypothetical protein